MAFLKAIKPFFPFSYREKTGKDLALSILVYVIIDVLATVILAMIGFIIGLLTNLLNLVLVTWLVAAVISLLGFVVGVYVMGGIAMSILHFTGVLDKASAAAKDDKKDAE